MIVHSIYYGAFPVRQAYRNGKLIWNYGDPIDIVAGVKISTYVEAILTDVSILFLESAEIIETRGEGTATLWYVLPLSAGGEVTSDTDAFLRRFQASPMESIALTESIGKAITNLFKVRPISLGVEHKSDTKATGETFRAIVMGAEDVSIQLEVSKPKAYALRILPINAEDVEIKSDIDAVAYSYKLVAIPKSLAESKSYTDLVARLMEVLSMPGKTENESFGSAGAITFAVLPLDSITSEYAETIASLNTFAVNAVEGLSDNALKTFEDLNVYEAKVCEVVEETKTETIANMELLSERVDFATSSWAKIAKISEEGNASNVFAIGDTRTIDVGGTSATIEIIGFDHDNLADGSGKAGITVWVRNCNNIVSRTDRGSYWEDWTKNPAFSELLTLADKFEADLQAVLKTVKHHSDYSASKVFPPASTSLGYSRQSNNVNVARYAKFKAKTNTGTDTALGYSYRCGNGSLGSPPPYVNSSGNIYASTSTTLTVYPLIAFCI